MPIGIGAAMLIGSGISAGTSLIGGKMASNASKNAAAAQSNAARAGSALTREASDRAVNFYNTAYGQARQDLLPYAQAGGSALQGLYDYATNRQAPEQFSYGPFSAPDPSQLKNDPSYLFRLEQGQNAFENSAAARGMLSHANTYQGLIDYGQRAASQEYQNLFDRALQTHSTNFQGALSAFNANRATEQDRFANLFNIAGFGQNAANTLGNQAYNFSNLFGDTVMRGAGAQAEYGTQAANANAAGMVGSSNAWSNTLGQIGNNAQMMALYNQVFGQQTPGQTTVKAGQAALPLYMTPMVNPFATPHVTGYQAPALTGQRG